ncbi:hypothetical protein HK101_004837 [Irineochytrium annulatum]|nr:hypothetical protein HK101_004837 [Irineochytrium annulatum]
MLVTAASAVFVTYLGVQVGPMRKKAGVMYPNIIRGHAVQASLDPVSAHDRLGSETGQKMPKAHDFERRIKDEERMVIAAATERKNRVAAFVSSWQNASLSLSRKSDLKKIEEHTEKDVAMAHQELLIIRKREMRALLEKENKDFTKALEAKGLYFYDDI